LSTSVDGPIRVLLVDDAEDIRTLLRTTLGLSDRFEVVGEAADGVESVREAGKHRPDVVVLDLAMPVMNGLEAIPAIRQRSPESKVVVLSVFGSDRMAPAAMRIGASGYVEKNRMQDLVPLLIDVHDGAAPPLAEAPPPVVEVFDVPHEAPGVPERTEVEDGYHAPRPAPSPPSPERAEEQLQVLAHELAAPVTAVLNTAQEARKRVGRVSTGELSSDLDSIARNAAHMGALIVSLADVRHLGERDLALQREATDLGALIRRTVADLEPLLETHRIDLNLPEGVVLPLDPVRIRQVVTNLLTNAIRFSPQATRVSVELRVADRFVEVSVIDEGPGIPGARQAQAFEKFSVLGTGNEGLGLGLYIARGLALAHGGELELSSEEGHGARFTLRLPLKG
jgi:CheY-like chemotaxis protein